MKPYHTQSGIDIYLGNCLDVLPTLDALSVQCCVTSPPYWGLRDYGEADQLGLESTPEEYIEKMVDVFREVWRVLRVDGTLWLNLGDSYANSGVQGPNSGLAALADKHAPRANPRNPNRDDTGDVPRVTKRVPSGLKPKDLVGIPWRVALALQADGWYLRQDIIWHKPNPMPESVTDRCTKAHEYIFLMTKSARYCYDADAVREPHQDAHREANRPTRRANLKKAVADGCSTYHIADHQPSMDKPMAGHPNGANKRSVWTVTTKPFKGAHFATFPPDLIEPCILAGCPEGGLVLDPFHGAGTTAMVAQRNGRRYVGCELNAEYIELSKSRVQQPCLF
jgi:site-specific DNA-methyltransferase (adenine-specific)